MLDVTVLGDHYCCTKLGIAQSSLQAPALIPSLTSTTSSFSNTMLALRCLATRFSRVRAMASWHSALQCRLCFAALTGDVDAAASQCLRYRLLCISSHPLQCSAVQHSAVQCSAQLSSAHRCSSRGSPTTMSSSCPEKLFLPMLLAQGKGGRAGDKTKI